MLLTLIEETQIQTLALPEKVSGRYFLRMAAVEGIDGKWILRSNRRIQLDPAGGFPDAVVLENGGVYPLIEKETGKKLLLFAEPETDDRRTFTKYLISSPFSISIGREPGNDICYRLPYVSGSHARLEGRDGKLILTDLGSANGTFVNGKRIHSCEVRPGDTIAINGLKFFRGRDSSL